MINIFKTSILLLSLSCLNLLGSEKDIILYGANEPQITAWQIVNDGVMGGLSKGSFRSNKKKSNLVFEGNLSLENNGGFSSIRSNSLLVDLSAFKGIRIKARGDGRTYKIRLESDARYRLRTVSFQHEFTATKGEWSEVFIPFDRLKASWRGLQLPKKKFNPKKIQKIGIIIADKKEGPFRMELDWIKASHKDTTKELTSVKRD